MRSCAAAAPVSAERESPDMTTIISHFYYEYWKVFMAVPMAALERGSTKLVEKQRRRNDHSNGVGKVGRQVSR